MSPVACLLLAAAHVAPGCRDAEAALDVAAAAVEAPESVLEDAWLATTRASGGTWRRATGDRAAHLLRAAAGLA